MAGEPPTLSIILPFVKEFPTDALVAILRNTAFCDYEILIGVSMWDGPDGSTSEFHMQYLAPHLTDEVKNKKARLVAITRKTWTERRSIIEVTNELAAEAKGKYIALVPGDVEPTEKWNHPQMLSLQMNPSWGWVCGMCTDYGFPDGGTRQIQTLHYSAAVFTTEAWRKVGGFDLAFKDGKAFDDDDLYLRFLTNGFVPHLLGYVTVLEKWTALNTTKKLLGAKREQEMYEHNARIFLHKWGMGNASAQRRACAPHGLKEHQHILRDVVHNLGSRIIDIGSGKGAHFGPHAVNVDIDQYDAPNFLRWDIEKGLPYDKDDFDVAVLSEVLEHVNDPAVVLREALRIARTVVLTIPNETQYEIDSAAHGRTPDDRASHLGRWAKDNQVREIAGSGEHHFHKRKFTPEVFHALVESVGGTLVSFQEMQVPYYIGWMAVVKR